MRLHVSLFALAVFLGSLGCGGDAPPPQAPVAAPKPSKPPPVAVAPAPAPAFPPVEPAALDADPTAAELSAFGLTKQCDASIRRAELLADDLRKLANAPVERLTWATTLGTLDAMHLALRNAGDFNELMAVAHPDEAVREGAKGCAPKVERLGTAVVLDDAIAQTIRRYAAKKEQLTPPRARFLDRMLKELKRNGADLDANAKGRLRELGDEISKSMQEFQANIAGSTLHVDVDPKSLDGLPAPYVAKHPKNADGKVRITTDYPDFFPFMQFAKDRKAALDLYAQFDNRAADKNVKVLERLLALRREKAKLLGYPTWADFVLEMRMAKSPQAVSSFLDDIRKHLAPIVKREMAEYEAAAAKLPENKGKKIEPGSLPPSDRLYLEEIVRKAKYGVDAKEVSEYFEVENVRKGLLTITSELFNIHFKEVQATAWHPDVTAVEVYDGPASKEAGGDQKPLGRFYMDLHSREGKYKHAAVFSIRDTRTMEDGKRLMPIAAIVCNFPKAATGPDAPPGLLSHQEASTFFHEFGHVLHHMLSTSELSSFSGTNVSRDFVEAPSQMLEEWTWSKPVLDRFAKHYKTNKPIPEALFAKMKKGRAFGRAVATQRQLFLSDLDQAYHSTKDPVADTTAVVQEVWKRDMPFRYVEGTHFQATFGHLMEYDAGYYGYQWALAIARDLFSRFEKDGLMARAVADDYRNKVLAMGSSNDEDKLVESFLGRPFNADRYKKFLSGE